MLELTFHEKFKILLKSLIKWLASSYYIRRPSRIFKKLFLSAKKNFTYFYHPKLMHKLKAAQWNEWLVVIQECTEVEKASFWKSFKSFEIDWACVYKEKFNEHFNCWHINIKWEAGVDDKKSKEEKWNKNKLNLKDWSEMLESWKGGRFFLCVKIRDTNHVYSLQHPL